MGGAGISKAILNGVTSFMDCPCLYFLIALFQLSCNDVTEWTITSDCEAVEKQEVASP